MRDSTTLGFKRAGDYNVTQSNCNNAGWFSADSERNTVWAEVDAHRLYTIAIPSSIFQKIAKDCNTLLRNHRNVKMLLYWSLSTGCGPEERWSSIPHWSALVSIGQLSISFHFFSSFYLISSILLSFYFCQFFS